MVEPTLTMTEILGRLALAEPLRTLPAAYLKRQSVAPFVDRGQSVLKLVVADPKAVAVAEEVRLASGMKGVEVLRADRRTVEGLIEKIRTPDWTPATEFLTTGAAAGLPAIDIGEADRRHEGQAPPPPASRMGPAPSPRPPPPGHVSPAPSSAPLPASPIPPEGAQTAAPRPARPGAARIILAEPDGNLRFAAGHILEREGYGVTVVANLEEVAAALRNEPADLVVVKQKLVEDDVDLEARVRRIAPRAELRIVPDLGKLLQGEPVPYSRLARFLLDMTDLFLSVIEAGSGRPKGQAHARAHYARLVAQKLGLTRKEIDETTLAAYLADFGEVLVRFRFGEGETGTETSPAVPGRDPTALVLEILRGLHPPYDVAAILARRHDGPDGHSGAAGRRATGPEAPAGARILSVVDLFVREKWAGAPFERIQGILRDQAGAGLDARPVEALLGILRDETFLDRLGQARPSILIADPDAESAALVELRLANEGYDVSIARSGPEALKRARSTPPDLVLSEVLLPGLDGFGLIEGLKADPATAEVPFVFVSSQGDSHTITQGLDLGAEDFLAKPVDLHVLIAKAKRFIARAAERGGKRAADTGGLEGSLDQISLPDMLQILSMSRKTVRLDIKCADRSGSLFLDEGVLTDATCGPNRGTDAFYDMMTFEGGTFSATPGERSDAVTIEEGLDYLILEGVRRFDEAQNEGRPEGP